MNGAGVSWAVNIVQDGDYMFYWRYASGNQRPAQFTLNGTAAGGNLDFVDTDGSWTTWYIQQSDPVYLTEGYYDAKLIATNGNGLGNIDYLGILAFSDKAAEALDCDSLLTSIDDVAHGMQAEKLRLYPVPASELVNIELMAPNSSIERVTLYNISGKTMLVEEASQSKIQLNVSQMRPGIYLVKVEGRGGEIYTRRLVIE